MSQFLEAHIVQLLKEGDERAVSLIYDNYANALYGVAFKITKNEALAQDAVQESLIKIWKKAGKYDAKKAKLFTWLFRITRNTAIDKLRSANIRNNREIQIDVSDVYNLGVAGIKPEHIDVPDHIHRLDEKYQEVLNALFFEGMTHQEASEALDIPLGTIKSRLKIGLRELRKVFNSILFIVICLA